MSVPHINASITQLPNGRVLIAGSGDFPPGTSASVDLYDPVANTFTAGPAMLTARGAHTATLLANGTVLVAGGVSDLGAVQILAASEIFDPVANRWTGVLPMPQGRYQATALLLPSGIVMELGGATAASSDVTSCDIYW
jgi:hypothetical protein